MPTVPLHSELERPWSARALANSQFRNEKSDLTTPRYLQCIGKSPDQVSFSGSCADWVCKIATKSAALNAVQKLGSSPLVLDFNSPQLTESSIQMAETFLVRCLKPTTDLETFDDLHLAAFNSNALKLDFERTACTLTNARKHIYRAYYQVQLSVQAPFRDAPLTMDAEAYGFERREIYWYLRL